MAYSGQLSAARRALSSSTAGTSPVDEEDGVALVVDVGEDSGANR